MTGRDLENLKHLPVPAPRDAARRAAMDAAMSAFDEAAEKSEEPSKGNVTPLRQTETSNAKRRFRVNLSSRSTQALAASLAALVIAAPFAFQHLQENSRLAFRETPVESPRGGGEKAAPPAPPVSVTRVEPTPAEGGEKDAKIALEENAKPEINAAAPAPGATPGVPSADQPAVADVRRADNEKAKLSVGQQSIGADNAQLGTDFSGTLFPGNGVTLDGGNLNIAKPSAAPAPAAIASLESDASARGRVAAAPEPQATRRILDESKHKEEAAKLDSLGLTGRSLDGYTADQRLVILEREHQQQITQQENRDKFDANEINSVKQVAVEPVSTFSIDVDTASYAFVRRALNSGHLPPKDAVRVDEMINYFPYAYPAPDTAETPFKPTVNVFPSPWNKNNKLVHVAVKGYDLKSAERPRANLVFLMDVSGSMQPEDCLPLVKNAFRLLLDQLKPDDTIGIVTYASGSGIALEPTKVSEKGKILAAIDRLGAGGSTAGAAGIADAYRLAEATYDQRAVNRVILATDGDFNVGITDQGELKSYIERKRQSGIFLSILGVGQGNHNDALMQTLAQNGNGTAAYVDTLNEARKVLVDESSSTLFTIAKDVKIQIEWNPATVAEYRLIGYETRNLKREDFNNDRVDAGDIGSGHTVTAIYEVTPVGAPKMVDDLRYAAKKPAPEAAAPAAANGELGFLKLRYKRPNEDTSQLIALPIGEVAIESFSKNFNAHQTALSEAQFSIAVAAFGQMLKGEPYTQGYSFDDVLALAQGARGDDPFGYRAEFLNLVRLAKSASP